jgi:hypothetical protein
MADGALAQEAGQVVEIMASSASADAARRRPPKSAHIEFAGVTVMPRSGWEPWCVFRKPCEDRVQDNSLAASNRAWMSG